MMRKSAAAQGRSARRVGVMCIFVLFVGICPWVEDFDGAESIYI
jgi:hypothetical protein